MTADGLSLGISILALLVTLFGYPVVERWDRWRAARRCDRLRGRRPQ
jgi:hypothetical protein